MHILIAIYLWFVAVIVIIMIIRDHLSGRCELLSIRNTALAGFIVFQLSSPALNLATIGHVHFRVFEPADPVGTGLIYSGMATLFLVLFLWAYRRGWGMRQLAAKMPTTWAIPNDAGLVTIAAMATALAVLFRFGVTIPIISIGTRIVAVGFAAISTGLIGWVWSRRLLNPMFVLISIIIVGFDFGVVMTHSFGRRGIVAVGGALVWGMYYAHLRHFPFKPLLMRLSLVTIPPVLILALFTSSRGAEFEKKGAVEQFQFMTSYGKLGKGIIDLAAGQNAGGVSMWIIESYPNAVEYQRFMTLWHFIIYPFPRAWWPDKPYALGQEIPTLARVQNVNRKALSVGVGIIGHAEADGGWHVLILYAILIGLYLRFFEEILIQNVNSPFVVLSVGCALGHLLGLFRGESSAFAFLALMTIGGVLSGMVVAGKLLEILGGRTLEPNKYEELESETHHTFVDGAEAKG